MNFAKEVLIMPVYAYKVRDKAGKLVQGSMEASDGRDLRNKLDEKGYFVVEYAEKAKAFDLSRILPKFGKKIKLKQISVFSWQLYTMLDAGVPLVESMKIIQSQTRNQLMRYALADVTKKIEEGTSFTNAINMHPEVFSRLYVQMINAGEVGGVLEEMIKRLAMFYERQDEVNSKIKSATMYPSILLTVSILVGCFLLIFILPKFVIIFEDMGVEVPLFTQVVLQIGFIFARYWYVMLGIIGLLFFAYKAYEKTQFGRFRIDELKLKAPIIGPMIKKTTISRFAHTLSVLSASGIPLLTCLDVVGDVVDNKVIAKVVRNVRVSVGEGKTMAQPLSESEIFPEMVVNMIMVGEETGAIDKLLVKVSEFYTREVNNAIETFTKLIEPVLIVLMTIFIGLIAVSIFLPLTDIMEKIHQ